MLLASFSRCAGTNARNPMKGRQRHLSCRWRSVIRETMLRRTVARSRPQLRAHRGMGRGAEEGSTQLRRHRGAGSGRHDQGAAAREASARSGAAGNEPKLTRLHSRGGVGNGDTSISRECGVRACEAGEATVTVWRWLDACGQWLSCKWWRVRAWAEPVADVSHCAQVRTLSSHFLLYRFLPLWV